MNYKKNMPDIELLMEAWPPEVEEIIGNVNLLTPELDIPLEDYARMVSDPWLLSVVKSFLPRGRTRHLHQCLMKLVLVHIDISC